MGAHDRKGAHARAEARPADHPHARGARSQAVLPLIGYEEGAAKVLPGGHADRRGGGCGHQKEAEGDHAAGRHGRREDSEAHEGSVRKDPGREGTQCTPEEGRARRAE